MPLLLIAAVLVMLPAVGGEALPMLDPQQEEDRLVAVTFDDLPMARWQDPAEMEMLTEKLLAHLRADAVPAIGFVNEVKVDVGGQRERRRALLESWLDDGHDLGNHTYSHASLYDTPLDTFVTYEVLRGEKITRPLMEERGSAPAYFRHAYLHPGPDRETKEQFEAFLDDNGYQVAPVTVENTDWLFNLAYRRAGEHEDSIALRADIADSYVLHTERMFEYYEALSRDFLGREIPQVLLLHANVLNARYMDRLIEMMQERGYSFTSLDEVMEDEAYHLPDDYINPDPTGSYASWIERWRYTKGQHRAAPTTDLPDWPRVPEWVREVANPDR